MQPNRRKLKSSRNSFRMHYQMNVSTQERSCRAHSAQFRLKSQRRSDRNTWRRTGARIGSAYLPLAQRAKCSPEPTSKCLDSLLCMYSCCWLTDPHTRARLLPRTRLHSWREARESVRFGRSNIVASFSAPLPECMQMTRRSAV
jgi:hypothetical protein